MNKIEKRLDFYIKNMLDTVEIEADYQGSGEEDISKALSSASKRQTGMNGRPEFTAVVDDFVIVIEDKSEINFLEKLNKNNEISLTPESTEKYAVNGAIWYLKNILKNTDYKKGFAIGAAGNEDINKIKPYYVDNDQILPLEEIKTFKNFSPSNINEYYRTIVLGEEPLPEKELKDILEIAEKLSNELRTYTSLTEPERAILVAAILLALNDSDFKVEDLSGDTVNTDVDKVLKSVETKLERVGIPKEKIDILMSQFRTIFGKGKLDQKFNDSKKTTVIKHFVKEIQKDLFPYMKSNRSEDYLGRFYEVFLRYSKEGKKEGIILTPSHITDLMVDLIDVKFDDIVLDPCCGTGTFLVSAMNKMLNDAVNVEIDGNKSREETIEDEKEKIKKHRIFGIEERDDLFSIATTNMILRGDGKSNIYCKDFFDYSSINKSERLKKLKEINKSLRDLKITKGLMNPPYSQRNNKETAKFSEIHFVLRLLNSVKRNGRVAVLVPLSAMIGNKNKTDRDIKAEILENNTLEGVITLQKDTFHTGHAGVQPCIAVFKAGVKHNLEKDLVKFINFQDDGYKVYKHIGLLETEKAKDKKQYLLDVWNENIVNVPEEFAIKTTIKPDDEWLHGFYYINEDIPEEASFEEAIVDFLTFEFSMIMQGKEYLFEGDDSNEEH